MPRFHINPQDAARGAAVLSPGESHHAISVLRVKPGEIVDLFDGEGNSFRGLVTEVSKGLVSLSVSKNPGSPDPRLGRIDLAVSVIKPERMELLIQKACELGVHALFPLITERCVVKLSKERWASKTVRWHKIALESCKQCGRSTLPVIHAVQDFKLFLVHQASSYDLLLLPTLATKGKQIYDILKSENPRDVLILIGPEGDFTAKETEWAVFSGAKPVKLGPLVMRSETAALYTLSVVQFMLREAQSV